MKMGKCYRKSRSMVARAIAEELVLVPIRQNVGNLQSIYNLNEAGAYVWNLLDNELSLEEIVSKVCQEYEVPRTQANADIVKFIEKLESFGAFEAGEK